MPKSRYLETLYKRPPLMVYFFLKQVVINKGDGKIWSIGTTHVLHNKIQFKTNDKFEIEVYHDKSGISVID